MAIETQAPRSNAKKEYAGYLNLKIKDKQGNFHSIPAFIGLENDKPIHRALLKKAEAGETEFEIVGYVNIKDDSEIDL